MSLQIRAIAIYSHEGERREVEFKLGALNIVTDASKTGKSALLDIVDYCWGRDECTVPEGEIRKSVCSQMHQGSTRTSRPTASNQRNLHRFCRERVQQSTGQDARKQTKLGQGPSSYAVTSP